MDRSFLAVSAHCPKYAYRVANHGYLEQFGGGARTCIGKNISLMEIGKLIPQLIRRFDFELVEAVTDVKTQNVWFVKQLDIKCRVRLHHR